MKSSFLKRLGWYLVGFSIGLVFLVFFVKKKSGEGGIEICYFPNCRVLKDIRSKSFVIDNDTLPYTELSADLQDILKNGTIDFGQSDTKSKPCKTYLVEHETDGKQVSLQVRNCSDFATILNASNR